MNALPSPRPSGPPQRPRRRVAVQSSQQRQQRQVSAIALEATTKLVVNLVVCGVALGTLAQLLPRVAEQQAKLREVQIEVKTAQESSVRVQEDFNRYFDPRQAEAIMREQTNLISPKQRTVVFSQPAKSTAATSAQLPGE